MRVLCGIMAFLMCCGAAARPPKIDRVFVIVLENQEASSILSPDEGGSSAPLLRKLALQQRIALNYFGVTHPSEPNYIAMIAGDYFGFNSDAGSCFTRKIKLSCHQTDAPNLIDELERKHVSWVALMQSMPSVGYLGGDYFFNTTYAEKHNPFVFFSDIARNPQRMSHIRPLGAPETIRPILSDPKRAPQFLFIVPDLCHDMHGAPECRERDALLRQSDEYVTQLISVITGAAAFTDRSALIVTWDEGVSNEACCQLSQGGGHVVTIVFRKHPSAFRSRVSYNHYSLLATLENIWGLALLGHTAERLPGGGLRFAPMLDLLSH